MRRRTIKVKKWGIPTWPHADSEKMKGNKK